MTDNLSIKSYSAWILPLGDVGRLTLKTVPVDAYNAASLTTSRTVQETVKLPYLAIQDGAGRPNRDRLVYGRPCLTRRVLLQRATPRHG